MDKNSRQEFWQGARDSLPVQAGIITFGLTCGILGPAAGLSGIETVLMSMLVFAGAAQFIGIAMIGAGAAGWGMIVFTTLLINLRHLLMGATLAPYMNRLPLTRQALLAFGITDESFVLLTNRLRFSSYNPAYHCGLNFSLYLIWVLSTAAGVLIGTRIPDPLAWGIDFVMPATFIALLLPRLKDSTGRWVCAVAASTSILGAIYLPGKWYIIIAALTASVAGGLLEGRRKYAR